MLPQHCWCLWIFSCYYWMWFNTEAIVFRYLTGFCLVYHSSWALCSPRSTSSWRKWRVFFPRVCGTSSRGSELLDMHYYYYCYWLRCQVLQKCPDRQKTRETQPTSNAEGIISPLISCQSFLLKTFNCHQYINKNKSISVLRQKLTSQFLKSIRENHLCSSLFYIIMCYSICLCCWFMPGSLRIILICEQERHVLL